ncbi:50S ribosomal protein L23 [Sedimentisphaera cyanobacteriorum]|uniref:Large ribosomal subunit protein uL23 n=1 Tax=Sedimentisphaera cyanobacteriorum TaxID=1940790 RepID=A0A1Q2HPN5_9BACT|nr:50S ribosomal protein L23 [Sedimentisphaera cyanobacteriorum]AQQ09429.1 50S ribosomal protein L23 [Sedimentisphaera cyanobacteriorum]
MDYCNVIIKPIITEQSMHYATSKNAYAFEVNKKANKLQIRKAVEDIYGVKVEKVRTMNRKGKTRRRGRSFGMTPSWKKAVVVLNEEDRIDLY